MTPSLARQLVGSAWSRLVAAAGSPAGPECQRLPRSGSVEIEISGARGLTTSNHLSGLLLGMGRVRGGCFPGSGPMVGSTARLSERRGRSSRGAARAAGAPRPGDPSSRRLGGILRSSPPDQARRALVGRESRKGPGQEEGLGREYAVPCSASVRLPLEAVQRE